MITSALRKWVDKTAKLTNPDDVHWCSGSSEEFKKIVPEAVQFCHLQFDLDLSPDEPGKPQPWLSRLMKNCCTRFVKNIKK
jgi:hypothetical protein